MNREKRDSFPNPIICGWSSGLLVVAASILLGLSISRLLFEVLFPNWFWVGSPLAVIIISLLFGALGWLAWRRLAQKLTDSESGTSDHPAEIPNPVCRDLSLAMIPFLPLFLNLFFLFETRVLLLESRFLVYASLWLAFLFLARLLLSSRRWIWLGILFCLVFLTPIFILTMGQTVGTADTFEFQVVVPKLGIAHPTGYPLYILLSKPFTWIPINAIAWRVNLATLFFALSALSILYLLIFRLTYLPIIAVIATVIMGLTPTLWSQAVQAEVYSLNALIVIVALFLMREIGRWRLDSGRAYEPSILGDRPAYLSLGLALTLGLGLTNHLTVVILLPAAFLTLLFAYRQGIYKGVAWSRVKFALLMGLAFILPLILYAYLPLRWTALNQDAMGIDRFIDWVIGGRFQGALQLTAWLKEWDRYQIVGRLIQAEWPWIWFIPLALVGLIRLLIDSWRYALLLLISWLGYVFYALNYIVPDLVVFLIPAFIIMTIWWGLGLTALVTFVLRVTDKDYRLRGLRPGEWPRGSPLAIVILLILITPFLLTASDTWSLVDASVPDGRLQWAQAVLDQPLDHGSTILADSDKFPPLYYLQQIDGMRPDIDIVLLPDEAAYRGELQARLQKGDTVYLARFLPGLESIYHLRSAGPLTEVSQEGVDILPFEAVPSDLTFGTVRLLGYSLNPVSPFDPLDSSMTFYWQSDQPVTDVQHIYTRWLGPEGGSQPTSQHPANNYYPTVAWKPGEIVADFHTLPLPPLNDKVEVALQVALAPPFTDESELAWQTVTLISFDGPVRIDGPASVLDLQPQRLQLGPVLVEGASFQNTIRPGDDLTIWLSGSAANQDELFVALSPVDSGENQDGFKDPIVKNIAINPLDDNRFILSSLLPADVQEGTYELIISHPSRSNKCGWLALPSSDCSLGTISVSSGYLPAGAVNFDDKIALLSVKVDPRQLQPGGFLNVELQWQTLSPMTKDYTIFLQVLDEADNIVGQVDSWPLQGTFPTSSWAPDQMVDDAFQIVLNSELAPGLYKLHLGWYLLEDLRRLPLLNEAGQATDDKLQVPGLFFQEDR